MPDRHEFSDELWRRGYKQGAFSVESLAKGDLIAYYKVDPDIDGFNHAGIYVGEGKVVGKFGCDGPVLRHDIKRLPSGLYVKELGVQWISYRKKE